MPLDLAATVPTGTPGVSMTFLHGGPQITRTVIPAGVAFFIPSHYHLTHTEFFTIEKGEMEITCDGVTTAISQADGEFKIPKGVRHSFIKKAEAGEPRDNEKERFFRNMFQGAETGLKPLQAIVSSYEADAWPDLPGKIYWLENLFMTVIGGYIGPAFG
ncbi:hypothetical protein RQP46_011130 [Phenoliferia psychrophenolica]